MKKLTHAAELREKRLSEQRAAAFGQAMCWSLLRGTAKRKANLSNAKSKGKA